MLGEGRTNLNYLVADKGKRFVVRIAGDIPEHHILRSNERMAAKCAYEIGVAPELIFQLDDITVTQYIEGEALTQTSMGTHLEEIIDLIKKMHLELPRRLYGPAQLFWVFYMNRNYAVTLKKNSSQYCHLLKHLMQCNDFLEKL